MGLYDVSKEGKVWSFHRRKYIKPFVMGGYYYVSLSGGGKVKKYLLARLVAKQYVPNPEGYSKVTHIDGDRSNNDHKNLKWVE